MANYDAPSLTYDSGALYDDPGLPQPNKKRMAKVKLNLFSLTDDQLLQKANDLKTALTGNANFTTPLPRAWRGGRGRNRFFHGSI